MKVLYVVHHFLPPRHVAGTEIYTFNLAREMSRRGHSVHIYYAESYMDKPQYHLERKTFKGLPCHEVVHNYKYPTFRHTWKDERMEEIFESVIREVRPDIVHFQHLHLHSIGYIDVAKAFSLPIIYTLHEYMLMCPRGGQLLKPGMDLCRGPDPRECVECRKDATIREIEERIAGIKERLGHVDLFISPSAFLRGKFIEQGFVSPEKIIHSDNGFDLSIFEGTVRETGDKFRFGYIGTIADYKGVHLIIEAAGKLGDCGMEVKIHGDPEVFPEYGRMLARMEKPPFVRLMGRYDHEDTGKVLAGLDVIIVPSLWYENSPLTIHEAHLSGIPVIASDIGGMAELLQGNRGGLLFERGNAEDLKDKMAEFLKDPSLAHTLVRRARKVKSIEDDARDMEKRYEAYL